MGINYGMGYLKDRARQQAEEQKHIARYGDAEPPRNHPNHEFANGVDMTWVRWCFNTIIRTTNVWDSSNPTFDVNAQFALDAMPGEEGVIYVSFFVPVGRRESDIEKLSDAFSASLRAYEVELIPSSDDPYEAKNDGIVLFRLWLGCPKPVSAVKESVFYYFRKSLNHKLPKGAVIGEVHGEDYAPTVHSIPYGVKEDGSVLTLGLFEQAILLGGAPGGGKSAGVSSLLMGITQLDNVLLVGIDLKRTELPTWEPRFSGVAQSKKEAHKLLKRIFAIMNERNVKLEALRRSKINPHDKDTPIIVVVIDELAELFAAIGKEESALASEIQDLVTRLVRLGRSAGIVLMTATQKPTSESVPTGLRDIIKQKIAYRTLTQAMTVSILGDVAQGGLTPAHEINTLYPGLGYVVNDSSPYPEISKAFFIPDPEKIEHVKKVTHLKVGGDLIDFTSMRAEETAVRCYENFLEGFDGGITENVKDSIIKEKNINKAWIGFEKPEEKKQFMNLLLTDKSIQKLYGQRLGSMYDLDQFIIANSPALNK